MHIKDWKTYNIFFFYWKQLFEIKIDFSFRWNLAHQWFFIFFLYNLMIFILFSQTQKLKIKQNKDIYWNKIFKN